MLVFNSFFNILVSLIVIYCIYTRHMRRLSQVEYLTRDNLILDQRSASGISYNPIKLLYIFYLILVYY